MSKEKELEGILDGTWRQNRSDILAWHEKWVNKPITDLAARIEAVAYNKEPILNTLKPTVSKEDVEKVFDLYRCSCPTPPCTCGKSWNQSKFIHSLLALLNGEKEVELCDHPESCHICAERMLRQ